MGPVAASMLSQWCPISHFMLFFFFFTEVSRAVRRRLFTVFDKRVIIMHTIADLNAMFLFWICMMNGSSGRVGQSTSSNRSLRNIIDHSAPRINNKQGKSALVGVGGGLRNNSGISLQQEKSNCFSSIMALVQIES